jgi:hypothetical protein
MLTLSGPSQCMGIPIDHMYSVLYSPYCTVHGPTATVHGPTTTVYFVDQSGVKPETVQSVCQFLVPWTQSCTDTDDPINSLRRLYSHTSSSSLLFAGSVTYLFSTQTNHISLSTNSHQSSGGGRVILSLLLWEWYVSTS